MTVSRTRTESAAQPAAGPQPDGVHSYLVDGRPVPAAAQSSIVADLLHRARTQPDRPYLTWLPTAGGAQRLSYRELEHASRALARSFTETVDDSLASQAGSATPVALLAENSLPCVLALFGLLRARRPCLLLNPRDPAARIRAILAEHPVAAVFAAADAPTVAAGLARPIPEPATDAEPSSIDDLPVPAEVPALLFATSGSTAASKLVVQPHRALTSNAEAVRLHHRLDPTTTVLGGLPIHHVNGLHFTLLAILHAGAHVLLPQELSPLTYRQLLAEHQPDIASVVPPMLESLLVAARGWRPPPSLRYFVSAAAPLSASLVRRVHRDLGVRVIQGYGLTETTNFSTTVPVDASEQTYRAVALAAEIPSVGVAVPGNEVAVLGPDGTVLGERQRGEVCMRGHNVMAGYAGRPELTRQAFAGGWFHSGDLGYWQYGPDGQRYFYLTGRSKNIAKVRGEAVSLEELERALLSLDRVTDAGCVALPHPIWGEQITALVVTDDADLDRLRDQLAALMPANALPSRWHRVPQIPRTPTGKLQRPRLAALVRDGGTLASMPAEDHAGKGGSMPTGTELRGTFVQDPGQPFIELRRQLLDSGRHYPEPLPSRPARAGDLAGLVELLAGQLDRHGLGLVQLDRCLDDTEFRALGERLGVPQPERAPDVQPRVVDGVILNLVTDQPASTDPARQPFAANPLSLHSESSGAPVAAQPRYIVLMCLSPGENPLTAQTIAVPMAQVYSALSAASRSVLLATRYDTGGGDTGSLGEAGGPPPVLRLDGERPVFSVRDFQDAPLAWTSTGAHSPEAVRQAFVELYTAMYRGPAYGLSWRPGLLAVIDNTRHFHGRTAGTPPTGGTPRHLKRLRIGVPA